MSIGEIKDLQLDLLFRVCMISGFLLDLLDEYQDGRLMHLSEEVLS